MGEPSHRVYVVDDDERIRASLLDLLGSCAYTATAFPNATAYLGAEKPDIPSCLILEMGLPDMSGLELQRAIGRGRRPAVIFVTGNADVPSVVQAMRAGAIDYLTKPFSEDALLAAVGAALERNRQTLHDEAELDVLRRRVASLTPREKQVFALVVAGLLNKQSASELGIGLVTLQAHRGKVMQKMHARSLADLVRMAERLRLPA